MPHAGIASRELDYWARFMPIICSRATPCHIIVRAANRFIHYTALSREQKPGFAMMATDHYLRSLSVRPGGHVIYFNEKSSAAIIVGDGL